MTTQLTVRVAKTIQEQQFEPLVIDMTIVETCSKKKYGERLAELTDLLKDEVFAALEAGDASEAGQGGEEGGEEGEYEEGGEEEGGEEGGEEGEYEEGGEEEGGEEEGGEEEGGEEEGGEEGDGFEDFFDADDPGGEVE